VGLSNLLNSCYQRFKSNCCDCQDDSSKSKAYVSPEPKLRPPIEAFRSASEVLYPDRHIFSRNMTPISEGDGECRSPSQQSMGEPTTSRIEIEGIDDPV